MNGKRRRRTRKIQTCSHHPHFCPGRPRPRRRPASAARATPAFTELWGMIKRKSWAVVIPSYSFYFLPVLFFFSLLLSIQIHLSFAPFENHPLCIKNILSLFSTPSLFLSLSPLSSLLSLSSLSLSLLYALSLSPFAKIRIEQGKLFSEGSQHIWCPRQSFYHTPYDLHNVL